MRTRKEIGSVMDESVKMWNDQHTFENALILETLLDIRDLLSKE